MKTTGLCLCLAVILTATAGVVSPAIAQSAQERPQPFAPGERLLPMLNRVLTDVQRNSLRATVETQRDNIRPLEEKLQAARRALLNAAVGGRFDEKLVRQNADDMAKAETALTVIYVKALSQIQPPLSPRQIEQLKNFRPEAGRLPSAPAAESAPEKHLGLPPPLPRDTNDLPVEQ